MHLADDLAVKAYLATLLPRAVATLIERAWNLTGGVLLVVEPGTPAGWSRILDVRRQLLAEAPVSPRLVRTVRPAPRRA